MTVLASEVFNQGTAGAQFPAFGLGTAQQVSMTSAGSTASAAVGATTSLVTFWSPVDYYVDIGAAASATTGGFALPGGTLFDAKVEPGVSKIAGRALSSSGVLYISERT
jgi:hypothetical protein